MNEYILKFGFLTVGEKMEARGQGSPRVSVVSRLFGNLSIEPNVPEGKNLKSKLCKLRK